MWVFRRIENVYKKKVYPMKHQEITSLLLTLHRELLRDQRKEQVFNKVIKIIRTFIKCDIYAILSVEGKNISIAASCGLNKNKKTDIIEINQSANPIRCALKTGKSTITVDIAKNHNESLFLDYSINSLLCVPVKTNGNISEIIILGSKKKNTFTQDNLDFVNLLSMELSSILERILLYSKVEELSIKDPLTGCFNYRNLFFDLKKEIERCKRYKKVFSVVMIDIDNFKKYNDKFGHQKGNKLLKNIAEVIRKQCRKADIIYRYGGDEFLLLLPESHKEGAGICAKRIEETIYKMNLKVDENIAITISTGIAGFPDDAFTPKMLIKLADRAMYKNKFRKKNNPDYLLSHS